MRVNEMRYGVDDNALRRQEVQDFRDDCQVRLRFCGEHTLKAGVFVQVSFP